MSKYFEKIVPNWEKYKKTFPRNLENIKFMERSFYTIDELWKLEELWKKINVELGILVLQNKEIDDKLKKLMNSVLKLK